MNGLFPSLRRGGPRILFLLVISMLLFLGADLVDPPFPPETAPIMFGIALTLLGVGIGDFALRCIQPNVDAGAAATEAIKTHNIGSGLVYLGRSLLAAVILVLFVTASRAAEPPAAALQYLPLLKREQLAHWPAMPIPAALGAQVEQETCISLKHRMCWNPRAELRTDREQGLGFGQFTRTWHKDGRQRFDALAEIVAEHRAELAGLTWANPYDPILQLRAMVLKDRDLYKTARWATDARERTAFMLAGYNGGMGGVMSDRKQCQATPGCNPSRWFGHVEHTSLKAKRVASGYGKSFFEINREYPRNILGPRLARYQVLA